MKNYQKELVKKVQKLTVDFMMDSQNKDRDFIEASSILQGVFAMTLSGSMAATAATLDYDARQALEVINKICTTIRKEGMAICHRMKKVSGEGEEWKK